MATDQIGEWTPTRVRYEGVQLLPQQEEGHAYNGLLVVPSYDMESGCFFDWEIWHQASGIDLFVVRATHQRALEIAAHLAEVVDWSSLSDPDRETNDLLRMKLAAFAAGYQEEIWDCNDWLHDDLDEIVPYG